MTFLATLIIIGVLVGYGLKEYYQIKLRVAPTSTPPTVITKITQFVTDYADSGRFLDMGSGWGKLVTHLAKKLPEWDSEGIEVSPTPWFIANCRTIGKNMENCRFYIGRMEKHKLKNYDIIYLNQPQRVLNAMLPRLATALRDDTFIITYPHPLPRLPNPDILLSETKEKIYLYRGIDALVALSEKLEAQAPQQEKSEPVAETETVPEPVPAAVEISDAPAPGIDGPTGPNAPEQVQLPLNYTD